MTKEAKIYNGKKTASSISGAGKTGELHVKKMKLEHPLTPYTKQAQNGLKPKCKPVHYKTLREKHRQNTL